MPAAFPPLSPEYDPFLYAVVCKEANGMLLTVASAIARSGADPWQEAALLSKMPRDVALRVLARLIPCESDCDAEPATGSQPTVDRLFALLPARGVVAPMKAGGRLEMTIFLLAIGLFAGVVLVYSPTPKSGDDAATPSAPAMSTGADR